MTALIKKDFYEAFTSFRSLILILLVFGAFAAVSLEASFLAAYLVILPGSLASSLVNLEEKEKWNSYCMTLPVTRKDIITAKYIFTMILVAAGALLATLINAVHGVSDLLYIYMMYVSIGLAVPTLTLPLTYKFGADKARYITMFIIIAMTLSVINMDSDSSGLAMILTKVSPFVLGAGMIVLFALSWFVSAAIYEGKEIR
ncbi:MAG: ABC-2 transporter permease [Solobacterium sp.]|nr:ABC-2 transporter permease [Solobacterium sp.]